MRLLRSILYRLYAIYDKACPLRYFIQKIRLYYAKNVICRSGSRFANTVFEGDNLVHKEVYWLIAICLGIAILPSIADFLALGLVNFAVLGLVYIRDSVIIQRTLSCQPFLLFIKILVKYLATRITLDYSLDLKCIGKLPRDIWLISDMMCGSGLM